MVANHRCSLNRDNVVVVEVTLTPAVAALALTCVWN